MKEIGGYFGKEELLKNGGEYHPSLVALNTARNALVYLAKARGIRKVFLPYFLCDSVRLVCEREKIDCELYHIDASFRPVFEKKLKEGEALYLVNYYGLLTDREISEYRDKFGNVIADYIHAFFRKPIEGIDTVYSCRKFFGVPDGAYLATDCLLKEDLPIDESEGRLSHILGRSRDGASAHYAEFKANDASFKTLPLMKMSGLTHKMLSEIDYEAVKSRREENFAFLHSALGGENRLIRNLPAGPYAYPFYCENGMALKKKLAEKKIYVATLWPNVTESDRPVEKDLAENILPLPCDQRYGREEMQYVIESIREEINKNHE